jgi:hypothetical protein
MNIVVEASRMFETLPAKLRERFDNDVSKLGAFLEGATDDDLVDVGLLKKMPPQAPAEPPPPEPKKTEKTPPAEPAGDKPA